MSASPLPTSLKRKNFLVENFECPTETFHQGCEIAESFGDASGDVWVINADGTGLQEPISTGASSDPSFSADGTGIVYSHLSDGVYAIAPRLIRSNYGKSLSDARETVGNIRA